MRFFLFILVLLSCCSVAYGDMIWLKNGDRLSGEILSKDAKKILLQTGSAGKIKINWLQVDRFSSDKELTFVLRDNNLLVGKAVAAGPGQINISSEEVLHAASIALNDIAAIHPKDYREREVHLSGRMNAGFTGRSGNTETEVLHIDGEWVARTEANRYTVGTAYNWAEDSDVETESNLSAYTKYDHFLDKNWYLSGNASFLRDRFRDLRSRSRFGVSVGYQVWETEERNLAVEVGMSYVNEAFFIAQDEEYPGARWSLQYDQFFLDRRIQFFHRHELNVGLETIDDLLFSSETGLRFPIKKNFNATLQYNFEWDNTPAQGKMRADEAYIIMFGYNW